MNKKISISAVGLVHQDHLSKYFRKIFVNNGNIINSSYTTNYNNFLLNADILFPKHVNLDFLDSKFNYQQNVFINSTLPQIPFHVIVNKQNKKLIHDPNIIKINTSCSDNCGIIYKHLSFLHQFQDKEGQLLENKQELNLFENDMALLEQPPFYQA